MKLIFSSLIIGLITALIDIIPMIIRKMDKLFILSAFFFWMIICFLIPRIQLTQYSWLNGLTISILVLLPLIFLIFKIDKEALPIICTATIILGTASGFILGLINR